MTERDCCMAERDCCMTERDMGWYTVFCFMTTLETPRMWPQQKLMLAVFKMLSPHGQSLYLKGSVRP